MQKKILVKAPILSRSGYGEQSRFALRALRSREDLFDIYIVNIPWGRTGQIVESNEEMDFIKASMMKTAAYVQNKGPFDISLQVTVPNEFETIAPLNIGYTAGIETTKVAPQWIEKSNQFVDRIIVVSNHSKKVFENTKYTVNDAAGNSYPNWGLTVPVKVVNYPVRSTDADPDGLDIPFETTKNFLCISQWGPRKNLDNTIRWFVEAFKDNEDAGLVLKTNTASDSTVDRIHCEARLEALLKEYPDKKCKIYMVHGSLTTPQLTWLYQHPTMKALINIGHGEGYGLPLFEAAYNGLPLVTVTWSGHMDFICKPNKKGKNFPRVLSVDYDLRPVQQAAVWEGVIQADSMWAFARETSYKRCLKEALEKEAHNKQVATALQKHILKNFTAEKMYEEFVSHIYDPTDEEVDWMNTLGEIEIL
jgi:glycosyltransferase involved in cell wall biosynthesis